MKSDKKKAKEIVKILNNEDFCFTSFTEIEGGRNSNIYKIAGENHVYALKIYPESRGRERIRRESYIYKIANKCFSKYTPRMIRESIEENWMLFSWVNADRAKIFTLNDISHICDFLEEINNTSKVIEEKTMNAADACFSRETTIIELERRIDELKNLLIGSPQNKESIAAYENILNNSKRCIRRLNDKKVRAHWKEIDKQKIISPSDMGVHNTLRVNKGVKFIDFEYAGYDDLAKLVCDIVIHPEYKLNKTKEDYLIDEIAKKGLTADEAWIKRYEDIKETRGCIWQTIMLRQYIRGDKETSMERIVEYGKLRI